MSNDALITYHLGGGMDDLHLLKNSSTIVGDDDFALGVLDLNRSSGLVWCHA